MLQWGDILDREDEDRNRITEQCCSATWIKMLLSIANFDVNQFDLDDYFAVITNDPEAAWAKVMTAALEYGKRTTVAHEEISKDLFALTFLSVINLRAAKEQRSRDQGQEKRVSRLEKAGKNFKFMQQLLTKTNMAA
jgi:hypothetical protein